jgi:hypothetical protein
MPTQAKRKIIRPYLMGFDRDSKMAARGRKQKASLL